MDLGVDEIREMGEYLWSVASLRFCGYLLSFFCLYNYLASYPIVLSPRLRTGNTCPLPQVVPVPGIRYFGGKIRSASALRKKRLRKSC